MTWIAKRLFHFCRRKRRFLVLPHITFSLSWKFGNKLSQTLPCIFLKKFILIMFIKRKPKERALLNLRFEKVHVIFRHSPHVGGGGVFSLPNNERNGVNTDVTSQDCAMRIISEDLAVHSCEFADICNALRFRSYVWMTKIVLSIIMAWT